MKVDLAGKIKNTPLPNHKALLPMFEAVVNSFQAIEDVGDSLLSPTIEVFLRRDPVLEGLDIEGEVNGFTIIDNGIGFNDPNLDSFFTSDTQYKVNKGGKGLGRFIWLKALIGRVLRATSRPTGRSEAGSLNSPSLANNPLVQPPYRRRSNREHRLNSLA